MIKVGVIGYGLSAKVFHFPFIEDSDKFQLKAISTSQQASAQKQFPGVKIYADAEALIAGADVDLIVITAPNAVHYSLAKACLDQGRHVIIEKPMVTTVAEADALIALAKQQQRLLSVFHNRRWDGDFLTVKKLIANDRLGDVRYFESHFDRFRPIVRDRWKEQPGSGAGILYDLGAHLIDQALCLFGMPSAITAKCSALRDHRADDGSSRTDQADDYFHLQLHYLTPGQRREVVLHSSPFSAGPNLRFQVQGAKGSFVKFQLDPQEEQLKNGILPDDPCLGYEGVADNGILYTECDSERITTEPGCYKNYYADIANAICHGRSVPVSAEEGMQVIRLIELAQQSSCSGMTINIDRDQ